jgi:hypothetical protein
MRPQWVCCCVRPSREENTNTRTARSLDPADCVAPENFNSVSSKFDLTLSRVYFSHFYAAAVSIYTKITTQLHDDALWEQCEVCSAFHGLNYSDPIS